MGTQDNDAAFDRIMESVVDDGPFQKRYNLIFNVIGVMFFAMTVVNVLLILTVPEHNCMVPGKEQYNVSAIERWRNLTLPREPNSRGELSYSSCAMYNISKYPIGTSPNEWKFEANETISCIYGYEYDRQYFDLIPITEENWVCDKELHATNIFAFIRFAEVSGTFVLGQLGDRIGRLPVYLLSIGAATIGRTLAVLTASQYWLFAALAFMGSFASNTAFQSPLIVAMEISKDENRAALSLWQLFGWTVGVCVAPLILWWTRNWIWFMLMTSVPCLLFYCMPQYNIESPRWLASQGRYQDCIQQLKKIAKVNKSKFHLTVEELKEKIPQKEVEKTFGIASLFSGWHMSKLTTLLLICWICNTIPTFTLFLMSMQMGGNPFLNLFWQGAVELPAYFCGQVLCDRIGRRLTNSGAYLGSVIFCIPVILIIHHSGTEQYVTVFAVVIKFFVCVTYFALYLQSFEVYPTSLRQTGTSFGIIISNIFGALGPYIVYLGTNYDIRLPFVAMGLIGLLGFFTSIYLPETLYQKLPDTMEEGRRFGKDQAFWSLPRKPNQMCTEVEYKLSQYEAISESQTD
ncbi:AAEL003192-PA [Aedes aegypti]|uniref:Major facilitator superfamily (MFS) profile domain-containing protein n=2 Tax=Aedes aegypti TaxID=7159 RepID=Q17G50_AEDAE|nr:solute carrier family 22 member 5 [Aedes aegypti]XP_021711759.1 solute carrier family 22 member 5 [Aedes aegypti]EAT45535.1 AAEL003192-PA [Aedes aegypti]